MPICWLSWAALNTCKKSLQWRSKIEPLSKDLGGQRFLAVVKSWPLLGSENESKSTGLKYVAVVTRCSVVEVWKYFSFAVVLFLQESSAEFDTLVKGLQANISQLKESTPNETVSELQVLVRLWKSQIIEVYNSQLISHVNLPRVYSYDVLRSLVTHKK